VRKKRDIFPVGSIEVERRGVFLVTLFRIDFWFWQTVFLSCACAQVLKSEVLVEELIVLIMVNEHPNIPTLSFYPTNIILIIKILIWCGAVCGLCQVDLNIDNISVEKGFARFG
jgi:hypothetical protein